VVGTKPGEVQLSGQEEATIKIGALIYNVRHRFAVGFDKSNRRAVHGKCGGGKCAKRA